MSAVMTWVPIIVGIVLLGSLLWEVYRLLTLDMHPRRMLAATLSAAASLGVLGLFSLLPAAATPLLGLVVVALAGVVVYATVRMLSPQRPQRVARQREGGRTAQAALRPPHWLSLTVTALLYLAILALALVAAL